MARHFEIVVMASRNDPDLLHRILNFKERLYAQSRRVDYLTLSDLAPLDDAFASMTFSVRSKSGRVAFKKLLNKSMEDYEVKHAVTVIERSGREKVGGEL